MLRWLRTRAVKNEFEFPIFVEFKIKKTLHLNFRCASGSLDAMTMSLHFNAFFSLSNWTLYKYQNIAEKENINAEMMLFMAKLKPSRSCIFILFSRGTYITVALASRLAQETSSAFIKHSSKLCQFFSISLRLMFVNEKRTICDWFSVLCIKLYMHT